MRLASFHNTTAAEIDARRWNPYLGISINNKMFTVDYLAAFMRWATARARQRAAVLIVDVIQRINNEVFDGTKPLSALEKAFRKADDVRAMIDSAAGQLSPQEREKLIVLEWLDITCQPDFVYNAGILKEEFESGGLFRQTLVDITRKNLGSIVNRLDNARIEKLALYLLHELPELIAGFQYEGAHYDLNVYPGKIASIYAELLEYDFFRPIHARLRLCGPVASTEAYLSENVGASSAE